jgi:hypothetical protein
MVVEQNFLVVVVVIDFHLLYPFVYCFKDILILNKWIKKVKINNHNNHKEILLHHHKTGWLNYSLALLEEWFIQECTTVEWD